MGFFATVATVFQPREELRGEQLILLADGETACAALARGAAKNKLALMMVYTIWAVAARYDVATWTDWPPSKRNPAGLPLKGRQLPCTTASEREFLSRTEIVALCNASRLFQDKKSSQVLRSKRRTLPVKLGAERLTCA